jgi:integrase
LQRLVDYFNTPNKRGKHREIPMRDIMEFSLWTARRIGEICDLRWSDLNETRTHCKVRVTEPSGTVREHVFPLYGKARDIIMRQPQKPGEPRIFPHNAKSASAAYTNAKKRVGIENLRFDDLRRECAIRLKESGHSVEQIAEVTGRMDLNSLFRDIGVKHSLSSAVERDEAGAIAASKSSGI